MLAPFLAGGFQYISLDEWNRSIDAKDIGSDGDRRSSVSK
jgi:hypothetical protein